MKNPEMKLRLLSVLHTLAVVGSGSAVTASVAVLTHADFDESLTLGSFVAMAAALALGYLVAGFVEPLMERVLRPHRIRLENEARASEAA